MSWHKGCWKCKQLLVFITVASVLTAAFGSASDCRVGVEDKGVIGRHKQAQVYLDKAQETHKKIEVGGTACREMRVGY